VEWWQFGVFVLSALLLISLYWWARLRYGRRCIEQWAKESGWDLLSVRFCFLGGPFTTTASLLWGELNLQTDTYCIVIGDGTGWTRRGYARVGYRFLGQVVPLLESAIRWDDAPAGQRPEEGTQPRQRKGLEEWRTVIGALLAILLVWVTCLWLGWLDRTDALLGAVILTVMLLFPLGARMLGRVVAAMRGRASK
jgi:hypothetical protein